jgi:hypothetical protein
MLPPSHLEQTHADDSKRGHEPNSPLSIDSGGTPSNMAVSIDDVTPSSIKQPQYADATKMPTAITNPVTGLFMKTTCPTPRSKASMNRRTCILRLEVVVAARVHAIVPERERKKVQILPNQLAVRCCGCGWNEWNGVLSGASWSAVNRRLYATTGDMPQGDLEISNQMRGRQSPERFDGGALRLAMSSTHDPPSYEPKILPTGATSAYTYLEEERRCRRHVLSYALVHGARSTQRAHRHMRSCSSLLFQLTCLWIGQGREGGCFWGGACSTIRSIHQTRASLPSQLPCLQRESLGVWECTCSTPGIAPSLPSTNPHHCCEPKIHETQQEKEEA